MSWAAPTVEEMASLERAIVDTTHRQDALRADVERQQAINGMLYGALSRVTDLLAEISRELLFNTGADRDRAGLDRTIEEVNECVAAAYQAASGPLYVVQMRVDLDGRDDVVVLAEARERLRAAGRRP